MAIYPPAVVKLVDRYKPGGSSNQPMAAYRRFQAHTAVSNGSLFDWFNQPGNAVSHFYVLADGIVEQYIDTKYRSSATLDGNPDSLTVESEDMGSPFPAWSGSNVPAWTGQQVQALAELGVWAHDTHGILIDICPNSLAGSKGFSYHRQGIDPWRVAGGQIWSKSAGKVCPGDRRVDQWKNDVIPLAQTLALGEDMATAEEIALSVWEGKSYPDKRDDRGLDNGQRNPLAYFNLLRTQLDDVLDELAEIKAMLPVGGGGGVPAGTPVSGSFTGTTS